jgi:hypothetical protein
MVFQLLFARLPCGNVLWKDTMLLKGFARIVLSKRNTKTHQNLKIKP